MSGIVKVFMGGDVCYDKGLQAVTLGLPRFLKENPCDFVIYNGENASGGNGLLPCDAEQIFAAGADVITGGNHIFEKRDSYDFLANEPRVLRPHNYPAGFSAFCASVIETPGRGFGFYQKNGINFAVLNIQGRKAMTPLDDPFVCAANAARQAEEQGAIMFVDFHAEANDEKEALALFLDGKICALCGTHTHVQTADQRILPNGTAYITDLGMTGVADSAIGSNPEIVIQRNMKQVLYKMESAEGDLYLQGALICVDTETKKTLSIERINYKVENV